MKTNTLPFFILCAFFLLQISISSVGQTIVYGSYAGLGQKNSSNLKSTKATAAPNTLELPFFDDFSDSYLYPSQQRWLDSSAYVNTTFAIDPPSIGVATLDAIDKTGQFYEGASYNNSYSADTLTSRPINLEYPDDNSIYLSFYYQPQGLGDSPEEQDSLLLEFTTPDTSWVYAWHAEGSVLDDFKHVIIHIEDEWLKKDSFQFRFRNVVSLSDNKVASKVGNVDHWHIDYIYLNNGRTASDVNPQDIAFVYPLTTHLREYEAMPWSHFLQNSSSELAINTSATFKNNEELSRLVEKIYFVFQDNTSDAANDTLKGGSKNMTPGEQQVLDPPFTYQFLSTAIDSASFTIKAELETDSDDPIVNNSISYTQKFYDYYAYDDGSAEAGFGLTGEGTKGAMLAYKFDCRKQDTLKAIQMYFNRTLFNVSKKYFYLTIWDDNNGEPGEVIYEREAVRPEYENELNKFHTYKIDDEMVVINGTFYVGWRQVSEDMLHIGLDFNRQKGDKILYNIYGSWENVDFEAALMIRPFFGKILSITSVDDEIIIPNQADVSVYPNPTSNEIKIEIGEVNKYKGIQLKMYSLTGHLVYQTEYNQGESISLLGYNEGVYLLQLSDQTGKLNYTQKIIKTK